jgi:SAM-dependent methyltransferase
MTVLKYYIEEKFNPVPITFSSKKKIEAHYEKRINLVENHLKIPLTLLKGKDVLEFGCNGGENACVLASYGANVYLVEPNKKMHDLIKSNFKKIKKLNNLKLLSEDSLEVFKNKKKFDLVIVEGFLNTLKKRNEYFKKISNFLKPKGILIINYDDGYGVIFEFLKSIILLKACKLNGINFRKNDSLKIAKKFFEKEFSKLNKSRNFPSWWKDQLVNPYASKTWKLKDILKLSNSSNLYMYSTSPIFDKSSHFQWYKNLTLIGKKASDKNSYILESWKSNFLSFLFNKPLSQKKKISNKVLMEVEVFVNKLGRNIFFANLEKKILKPKNFLYYLSANNKKKLSNEISKLINTINNCKNENELLKYYNSTSELKKTWGSVLHYIALIKS